MTALCKWFNRRKNDHKGRTRSAVIVNEVKAAEPPRQDIALESKRERLNLFQSIVEMEKRAATLNTSLAALTLQQNTKGVRS